MTTPVTLYTTAVDKVIRHIMSGLKNGSYVPGQRLAESDLSAATGVGRSPVREALRILSGEGVISLIPNQGARLREMTREDYVNFINATAALIEIGLELAIDHIHIPQNEKKVRAAYETIQKRSTDLTGAALMEAIYEFYLAVNDITGNEYLNKFMRRFHFERLIKELERNQFSTYLKESLIRYDQLFQALLNRDRSEVRRLWAQQTEAMLSVKKL